MAKSANEIFLWSDFYEKFTKQNSIYEFKYKDKIIFIGMIEKGRLNKRKVWHFVVNNLNNNDKVIYSEYGTAELLLENACIEGKKIRELWEDLIIE